MTRAMTTTTARCARLLALAVALSFPALGAAPAHALSLIPISQDFEPSGRGATQSFRLENEFDAEVAVSVKIMTRKMALDGTESNAETSDFQVFPSQVVMGPRQSQVVRVQWTGPANPQTELAYRIVAEQLPIKTSLAPNTRSIQLVVRYVGAVYVVPKNAAPQVRVDSLRAVESDAGARGLEVVLDNQGRAHTLLSEPTLTVTAGGVSRELKNEQLAGLLGENILARSKRTFVLPWPAGLPFAQPEAIFDYTPLR